VRHRSKAAGLAAAVMLALVVAGWWSPPAVRAQQASSAAQTAAQGPTAAEKYMNVQVLKDVPAAQLRDAMVFMAASLGTNCGFCHVRSAQGEWAFEKDDKAEKKTARKMLQLTRGLNAQYFDGEPTVTCASCHQARHEPNPQPPFAQPLTPEQAAMMAARGDGQRPPAPTETVDQVVAKYVQALGGEERLRKLTSAVMRGTVTNRAGQASPVVLEQAATDRYRSTVDSKPPSTRAYDGTAGWLQDGGNVRELEGVRLTHAARLGDLGLALRLKDTYARLAVGRYERIDGHDAISLTGRPSPAVIERLSFDRVSGLLLRRVARLQTPMGDLPLQIDYADYRDVDGVKVPFEVRVTDWENVMTQKFAEVQLNAPVDAARFRKPG
jgi:photosynthetic reaction center cytochrome c subunit